MKKLKRKIVYQKNWTEKRWGNEKDLWITVANKDVPQDVKKSLTRDNGKRVVGDELLIGREGCSMCQGRTEQWRLAYDK